ncbi:hypothetical protein SAMN05421644_15612 [Allochromatium warmingii]|uniref:Uncharacterized protein n=1 Tax=Allochromatium warmingii TaxID=61595 RepID=A0A1H3JEA8_ALLWA|nr:hypothetical protein [Allochromatium warmingii]SDY37919.1 hypothetical protein SAMN05421644_15612 [Allochromatium warmingii]
MNQSLTVAEYPIYSLELTREETPFDSVEAICGYFRACIESHRSAVFIAEFDHYAHTCSLPEGHIGEEIRAAKNLVFCFGISLPKPELLACRPRSIGVAETDHGFLITFMETPMPVANSVMEDWAMGLCQQLVTAVA